MIEYKIQFIQLTHAAAKFPSTHKLPADILENPNTTTIQASVLDFTDEEMMEPVKDCELPSLGLILLF